MKLRVFSKTWGRLSLGMAALLSIVIAAPAWSGNFAPLKALFVFGAFTAWVMAELASDSDTKAPNPNDVVLFGQVNDLFNHRALQFLREHEFGGAFSDRDVLFCYTFDSTWIGAIYAFQDKSLNTQLMKCKAACSDFIEFIEVNTFYTSAGLRSARHDTLSMTDERGRTLFEKRRKKLNELSSALYAQIDALQYEARRKGLTPE
ncbi:hypothetical protein [Asticcacaulis sp. MM231]|uniref:hypothetical protein n=1 Tax=Asticcacaulis sp. MM231 TaxID=3157666 RepID=UPI0032D5A6AE